MTDYQKVLELEPSNKAARLELDKLREKCASAASSASTSAPTTADEEKKTTEKLDLKANISKMFAASSSREKLEGVRERETRHKIIQEQQLTSADHAADPLLVMPVVKPPHLRSD